MFSPCPLILLQEGGTESGNTDILMWAFPNKLVFNELNFRVNKHVCECMCSVCVCLCVYVQVFENNQIFTEILLQSRYYAYFKRHKSEKEVIFVLNVFKIY